MSEAIDKLAFILEKANDAYRTGDVSWFSNQGLIPPRDKEYDNLLVELEIAAPDHEFLKKIGYTVEDTGRKQPLPVPMLSADKVKTLTEIHKWITRYNIPPDAYAVLSPKLDGLSLLQSESKQPGQDLKKAWTRGDGIQGQRSDAHVTVIEGNSDVIYSFYTMGEGIISRKNYDKFYRGQLNPKTNEPWGPARNIAAGAFNKEVPDGRMAHIDFIRFGLVNYDGTKMDKSEQLEMCNKLNKVALPYRTMRFREITEEILDQLFTRWSKDYEIDGIVIDVDNADLRTHLGIHTSGKYPNYMMAYKAENEEVKETRVKDVIIQISKQGLAKPVLVVEEVVLDGAKVTRVTGNNMLFVDNNQLGPGAKITIKRSGYVIPKLVAVIVGAPIESIVNRGCPICSSELIWGETNDAGVITDMVCSNLECDGKKYKQLLSFFTTLKVPEVGPGTVEILYNAGFTTVEQVLLMDVRDLSKLEGFGPRKAELVHSSIAAIIAEVPISKMQHASGFFSGLGSRKLKVINEAIYKMIEESNELNDITNIWDRVITPEEIIKLDGFAEKSADIYFKGIDSWWRWLNTCDLHFNVDWSDGLSINNKTNNLMQTLTGQGVVFTGFRDADLEAEVTARGGSIKSGVSKNSSILVMKVTGSGSGKERKAQNLGQEIYSREEFIAKYIV